MADETSQTNGNGEPPRIRLNINPLSKPKTGPKDVAMSVKATGAAGKVETTRIDLSQAVAPTKDTQKVDTSAASKMTTMRVEIVEPQQRKSETTRIDLAAAAPKPVGRVDLGKEPGSSDGIFSRNTMAVGVPTPPPMAKPKTIQVKKPVARPNEPMITTGTPTPEAVIEAKKSETARIDLPPEGSDRPATRPKTIRIKRPDGSSGRKSLTIARPAGEEAPAVTTIQSSFELEDEGPGTAFSILALVAVLVACVVVYVLAAQTIAPTLPFPGRLV
jgi:hypothetical protein